MIQDVQSMQSAGYSCTLAHDGTLKKVTAFDVLKSSIMSYPNVGLMDGSGAFTSISAPMDMKNLKSLMRGEEPAFATTEEAELFRKVSYLNNNGYSFNAHLEFWPAAAPTVSSPEANDYRIDTLQLIREFKKGNRKLWAVKGSVTSPLSSVIDVMGYVEKVGVSTDDASVASPENTIIVGGVKLPVNTKVS